MLTIKQNSFRSIIIVGLLNSFSFFPAFTQSPYEAGDPVQSSWIFDPAQNLAIDIAGFSLIEGKTFSFREDSLGVKTDTYYDVTKTASWNSSPYKQGYLFRDLGEFSTYMNYRLHFPSGYDSNFVQGYPLILFMHGAGERGNCWGKSCYWSNPDWRPATNSPAAPTNSKPANAKDNSPKLMSNDLNLLNGGQAHDRAINRAAGKYPDDPTLVANAWPGFVVVPQNLDGWANVDPQDAIRIVRLLLKKYRIDPNRVFVHGLSDGGAGVYEIIKRAPWLFAGALPMVPIDDADIQEASSASQNWIDNVANIPLWQFQGGIDTVASPVKNQFYIDYFRDYGMDTKYTVYPTLGHSVWNNAYAEPDFFSWMRNKNKANIFVRYQNTSLCASADKGVELRVAYGFWGYQWQRDGANIPGANSAVYFATTPGTYRARFSRVQNPTEAQWNRWSDPVVITQSNVTTPQITVVGSTQLPGKNSEDSVLLKGPANNKFYYWYKNGTKLDFSPAPDTMTYIIVNNKGLFGNGDYSLQVAADPSCKTPMSDTVSVRFNAPETINAPSNFYGIITSPLASSIDLFWRDNSTNETSFEIYRAVQKSDTYFLIAVVNENITSYTDNGVETDSTYKYQMRAVNTSAKSAFTPDYVITDTFIINGVEKEYHSSFNVFPVPGDQHNLKLQGDLPPSSHHDVTIEMLDVNGKICLSTHYSAEDINLGVTLDSPSPPVASGVYMVILKQGNIIARRKIMIY